MDRVATFILGFVAGVAATLVVQRIQEGNGDNLNSLQDSIEEQLERLEQGAQRATANA